MMEWNLFWIQSQNFICHFFFPKTMYYYCHWGLVHLEDSKLLCTIFNKFYLSIYLSLFITHKNFSHNPNRIGSELLIPDQFQIFFKNVTIWALSCKQLKSKQSIVPCVEEPQVSLLWLFSRKRFMKQKKIRIYSIRLKKLDILTIQVL